MTCKYFTKRLFSTQFEGFGSFFRPMPKELAPAKLETTIHLQKAVHDTRRRFRAEKAIKVITAAGQKMMHTDVVKIDPELNSRIWIHGKNCPPARIRVVFERKADEEDAEKMITIASYKNVASFAGLQTTKVVDQ